MTTTAMIFMGAVHCIIYTGIFVALRKILKHESSK